MADRTLPQLLDQLRALLSDLQGRYGVQPMGIFGSYVREQQASDSDLDLLVEFHYRPLSLFDTVRLENELSDALNVKVDLVERRALKPHIGKRILAEAVVI